MHNILIRARTLRPTFRHASLYIGAFLGIIVLAFSWLSAGNAPRVDSTFSYNADLQINKSVYDPVNERYQGDTYEVGALAITTNWRHNHTASLRSSILTSTLDSQTTTQLEQQRIINVRSGQSEDPIHPNGYVLPPRNLVRGASFSYFQPPYTQSITMRFSGEEQVSGLLVYRYTGTRDAVSSTHQTAGSDRYQFDPRLTLWVEPTTGWLIKAQENTTAYTLDTTNKRHLAYHMTSSYAPSSIRQHVNYARQLKYRLTFGLQVAPTIVTLAILLVLSSLLVRRVRIRSVSVQLLCSTVLAAAGANIVGWACNIRPLITLAPNSIALNPMASVCFICIAGATLALYYKKSRRYTIVLASLTIGIAFLSMLYAANIIPFSIDTLLFGKRVLDLSEVMPDRLSLFGDLAFIILGACLIKAVHATKSTILYAAKLLAGIAVGLGGAGLLAKLLLLDQVFVVPTIASLSVSGSVLCIFCGLSILQVLIHCYAPPKPAPQQSLAASLIKPALITIPLVLIGVLAQVQQNVVKQRLQSTFDGHISAAQNNLATSAVAYTNTLVGAKALFSASVNVERGEWTRYVDALRLGQNYPGVQSIAYAQVALPTQQAAITQKVRSEGLPAFEIFPASSTKTTVPILYVEPFDNDNRRLLGFDLSSEGTRNNALSQAATSGNPTLSGKLSLLTETAENANGFALILPIYRNNAATDTAQQRMTALSGYLYASFQARSYFASALKAQPSTLRIAVYDGFGIDSERLLYSQGITSSTAPTLQRTETITIAGRPWTVAYSAYPELGLSAMELRTPSLIMVIGSALYIGGLVSYLWLRRSITIKSIIRPPSIQIRRSR